MLAGSDHIQVPDLLWTDPNLVDGAKLLWCHVRAASLEQQAFTYGDLRRRVGVSHNTLLRYLKALEVGQWLSWTGTGRHRLVCSTAQPEGGGALSLPVDLIADGRLAPPARWTWGLVRRHGGSCDYRLLREKTGHDQGSISKYLAQLRETGWLVGSIRRVNRRSQFDLKAVNPFAQRRKAELADLDRALQMAKNADGYSLGQCLMAWMVRVLVVETSMVENAEVVGLENLETGGRMHYDLYLPVFQVALEFQGPQHDGPTERFTDPHAYWAQYQRDSLKLGLSQKRGIKLLEIRPHELSFAHLRHLLQPWVPLAQDLSPRQHLYDRLDRVAASYRRKTARPAE